jgi:hypothetical protein
MATSRVCSIPECGKPHRARGYCIAHYYRALRDSRREALPDDDHDVIHPRVCRAEFLVALANNLSDECILWPYKRLVSGYGQVHYEGKPQRAHRVSYKMHVGPLRNTDIVRHSCDTPACVNPRHLLSGSYLDNTKDMISRGRHTHGSAHPHAKLNDITAAAVKYSTASLSVTAKEYGISPSTVWDIRQGRKWKHV